MVLTDDFYIPTNDFQTPITKELLQDFPDEVVEQFLEFISTVDFIQNLISPDRKRAKDLPRDDKGRIIVDITNPHILEDMDYFRPAALHYQKHGCYTFLRPNPNPNSEYAKWFHEEKRRCREGYVRESDGEWVTGYLYFFLNYCPIMLTKITGKSKKASRVQGFPEFWEGIYWRTHYLDMARNNGHHAIELARRGAHPYFQKVITPEGWKKWGDVKIGDKLFATDGTICNVIDIPYDKTAPYYKIKLIDGREVYASDDHLWKVIKRGKEQLVTTKWLVENYRHHRKVSDRAPSGLEHNVFIPKNEGIDFPYQEVPVDPYTFGLLLGDGCFRASSCVMTQTAEDFEIEKQYIPYDTIKRKGKYDIKINIPNWQKIVTTYGLFLKSEDKFILDVYKYNSREVRLNLLKGLLDSDGYVHGGVPVLTTTSTRLLEDVSFIARSLGYNVKNVTKKAGCKKDGVYKQCLDVIELSIYGGEEVFNLPRKKARVHYNGANALSRKIKTCIIDIQYMGECPCKCVTVDSWDNCYLVGDFITTHNCGKSYFLASMMAHNFLLGENQEVRNRTTTILTAYQKEYLAAKDGTLSKFEPMIDFVEENMEFSKRRLSSSLQNMFWQSGYVDSNGRKKGQLNTVMGVSSKDDEGKLRGKRGHIYFEEMGSFSNLLSIYNTVRYGLEEGEYTYGLAYLVGTAAEDESDFNSAKELLYSPSGYNIQELKNVYDKPKQGKPVFGYFFPSYVNRKGCYNEDGVSDVVKAILQILMNRYETKYNSADPSTILRVIAEMPITPAEAIIKVKDAYFPVTALTERLTQLDTDSRAFDDIYIGDLVLNGDVVKFVPSSETPIRDYPVKNNERGALEIYEMPQKDPNGKVVYGRYIVGHDPVNNDQADSASLSSTFVLDLFTDRIVAEYTGRQQFMEDSFEIVRLLCLFYNAQCCYESNSKGCFSYFSKMKSLHLLADTPEYLRDKQLIKYSSFGANAKGINASAAINDYANRLIREWLLKPVDIVVNEGEESKVTQVPNLYQLRGRALVKELISFNSVQNFDRIRALGMVMLFREEKMILYGGNPADMEGRKHVKTLADDDFFTRNYDSRF